jgi:elongation factor Ts
MTVTPKLVKELRDKTGAGMMDCKAALAESKGDLEGAVEILRKKGMAIAQKKSGRTAADGLIGHYISGDKDLAVLIEVNCETDFVTKTDDFRNFVSEMTGIVRDSNPKDIDHLMSANFKGRTVKDVQTDVVAKIGENLGVRRFSRIATNGKQKMAQYIHAGSKIGVVIVFDDPSDKLDTTTAHEIAMHVAAMHPQYVRRTDVPERVIAKEKEIMAAQMGDQKKPPEIMDKILSGKVNKFFTEVCLDDQVYVKDPEGKSSVSSWLKKIDGGIKINSFVRLQVGEGIEKKS